MYAPSYIAQIVAREPTWATCVELYNITKHAHLGRLMGALASAIRSGSEVTHEDWGEDWIELSVQLLDGMEPLRTLTQSHRYDELDAWLKVNEQRIIDTLHHRFVHLINQTA